MADGTTVECHLRHGAVTVNGVRLHAVEAGDGPPVLLLHGFPEFWYSWRRQLPALAAAGFRAIAVDLRGYNESDKPPGLDAYRVPELVADAAGLVEATGAGRAAVVGHDWGGVIAWRLAQERPERVGRLAILNAPHPAAFRRDLKRPGQMLRSSYALFFQLPGLPEWSIRRKDFALVRRVLRETPSRPGAFSPEDVERYVAALRQPGALAAGLNYYRAALRRRDPGDPEKGIEAPTLLVWGEEDPYLRPGLTRGLERWVPRLRVERLPGVGHWVQNEAPEAVNRLLVEFLRAG